jgi:anti-sigma regulatory factor (Ser/Thr protein kinase)
MEGLPEEVRASSVVMLPHTPSSVAVARRRLCTQLLAAGIGKSTVTDAAVILSELLSNALRHARPLLSGEVRVAWNRHGDVIELSVSDGGASTEPRRGRPTLSSLGGRGLGIVESLADCWGVRREEGATTVWALLHVTRPAVEEGPIAAGTPALGKVGHPTANLLRGTR